MAVGNLTAWNVEASSFPASGTVIDKARFAVRYAILAPSSHNTQPWRFIINGDELLVCADRTRSLSNIDPFDRELIISCGAALFNLRVTLAHFEVPVEITTFPQSSDPHVVARIVFPASGPKLKELAELFNAITKRTTNRGPFSGRDVPAAIVERLKSAATAEGVDVAFALELAQRERLAALIAKADRAQFDDPRFRRELANWIHPSRSNDGMPTASQGLGVLTDAATPIVAMAIRTFDLGNGVAAAHEELARGSPLLVALSTPMDNNEGWLAAGLGLQRLLLAATKEGYSTSYLNQPIEVPDFRGELAKELSIDGYPQLLLRVGVGRPTSHSPRRPISDVLI
jgi:Nitroreductase family